jgi:membrane fusion protein, copper/silver efflux system
MLLIGILLSCGTESGSQEPIDKVVVITQPKHEAPQKGDFEQYSFGCCTDPEVTELSTLYLSLQEAMADDDSKKTTTSGAAFHQKVLSLTEAHPDLKPLSEYTRAWGIDSLKEIRLDFEEFNSAFIPFIEGFKSDEAELRISKAFCPMAPGRWLQKNPKLLNPYYGHQMLRCGVFEE